MRQDTAVAQHGSRPTVVVDLPGFREPLRGVNVGPVINGAHVDDGMDQCKTQQESRRADCGCGPIEVRCAKRVTWVGLDASVP